MNSTQHIHGSLRFWSESTLDHDVKMATGKLQVPGSIDTKRNLAEQRAVSKGRGDDAGHLIGHQFGGPEAPYNLSIQNYRQNQGGGTYWDLEQRWASQFKSGIGVDVTVREMTRKNEDRPYHRHVTWLEEHKDRLVFGEVDFMNAMSPKGRAAEGIPSQAVPGGATIHHLDTSHNANRRVNPTELRNPIWSETNPFAAKIGPDAIKRDMETAKAGLLYGLPKADIELFLKGVHPASPEAGSYAKALVDSVRFQIRSEIAHRGVGGRER